MTNGYEPVQPLSRRSSAGVSVSSDWIEPAPNAPVLYEDASSPQGDLSSRRPRISLRLLLQSFEAAT